MRSIRWVALCLFAALPALAEFEGVLEMKITMKGGTSGTGKTYVSKNGWRTEMNLMNPQLQKAGGSASMKMTMLGKIGDPDKVYSVDDERKTYSVMDARETRKDTPKQEEETYTVRKLGGDMVAGYACEKVLITSSKGNEIEGCATREIIGSSAWLTSLQRGRGGAFGGWTRALKEAGVGPFLIRMAMHDKGTKEETMRMELVRADRKSVPSALFEIPRGYTEEDRSSMMMGQMAGQMSPEQQEKMRKAMEGLTPEQRKMMEDAMKARGQRGNN